MECLKQAKSGAQILLDYCSGALEPAAAAEVERHTETCDGCRQMIEAQREVWETLGQWTAPAVSQNFNARLYARIAQQNETPRWRQWIGRVTRPAVPYALWKPAALATACAVLAVGFLVHVPPRPAVQTSPQMSADRVDIEQVANALEELDVLMPSGSSSAM
jgi:anti-sigma factor RsiW